MTLSGQNNNFTGTIEVGAGTLSAGSTSAFGPTTSVTVDTGATLDLGGNDNAVAALSGSGTVTTSGAGATLTVGDITDEQKPTISSEFDGTLQDGPSGEPLGLTVGYSSDLTLGGTSKYSGSTEIEAGTLTAAATTALSASSPFTVDKDATLDLAGNNNAVASLAGSGTVTTSDGPAVLTVGSSTASSSSFAGNLKDGISGTAPLALTKVGSNELTLTSTSTGTYSGDTIVSDGILDVEGSLTKTSVFLAGGSITGPGAPPAVVTPAAANPVTDTTVDLTAVGEQNGNDTGLTYRWTMTAMPTDAADPTFSATKRHASRQGYNGHLLLRRHLHVRGGHRQFQRPGEHQQRQRDRQPVTYHHLRKPCGSRPQRGR